MHSGGLLGQLGPTPTAFHSTARVAERPGYARDASSTQGAFRDPGLYNPTALRFRRLVSQNLDIAVSINERCCKRQRGRLGGVDAEWWRS